MVPAPDCAVPARMANCGAIVKGAAPPTPETRLSKPLSAGAVAPTAVNHCAGTTVVLNVRAPQPMVTVPSAFRVRPVRAVMAAVAGSELVRLHGLVEMLATAPPQL